MPISLVKGEGKHWERPCYGIKVIQGNVVYVDHSPAEPVVM
jgi:hypothetical protein